MPSKRFNDAFERLARAEQSFLENEFLAPVIDVPQQQRNAVPKVRVLIAGITCELAVTPAEFRGWGVFRPVSHEQAELVRPAGMAARREYLRLFPTVRFILCKRDDNGQWLGVTAHAGDTRFQIVGLVPLRLVEDAEQFETVATRFDGVHFWFDGVDPQSDPMTARHLRQALIQGTSLDEVNRPGLTPEQRAAYAVHFVQPVTEASPVEEEREAADQPRAREARRERRNRRADAQRERLQREAAERERRMYAGPAGRAARQLRAALTHAGAQLLDYVERHDGYRVTYTIDGVQHTSSVDHNLDVQVAGICLDGEDAKFDLQSLVGVIREGEQRGAIYRMD